VSKILTTTSGTLFINDTGVLLSTTPYTIPPQDYLIWAASNDIIGPVGTSSVTVNDGSINLSISDGIDLIKDIFPKEISINGSTDGTNIGNVTDRLKVIDQDVLAVLNAIASGLGVSTAGILKQNEITISSRTETDLSGTTYTVPTGKKFSITSFSASYDFAGLVYIRFKKQTGGSGAFNQLFRIVMMQGSQGDSAPTINFGNGVQIGTAGDVFKITIEGSVPKGTVWAEYSGSEI